MMTGDITAKYVDIDLSRACLLARMACEGRKVINDSWLSANRRTRSTALYVRVGNDFNRYFRDLGEYEKTVLRLRKEGASKRTIGNMDNRWYRMSVFALRVFGDNLSECWHYAYSGNLGKITWLTK